MFFLLECLKFGCLLDCLQFWSITDISCDWYLDTYVKVYETGSASVFVKPSSTVEHPWKASVTID